MNTAHLHVLRSLPCSFATPRSIFRRGPAAGCSRRGPPCGPARAGAAGGSRPRRRSARRTRSPRRARRRRRRRRAPRLVADVSFRLRPRAAARDGASLAPSRASDERGRFARRAATSDRASPNAFETEPEPSAGSSPPTPLLEVLRVTRRGSVAPWFFLPSPSPTFQPAFRSIRNPTLEAFMVADAPGGGPADACGRPEKPAGDFLGVAFPGPDASPRAVPVAGATSGGASEGWITPPDVNRVVIPSPDRKTSPGGPEPFPKSTHDLHRTSPPLEEHPGAPRPGVAKPASCEAAVLKKRACFDFRGKLQVSVSFPKKKIWCAPRALRTRVARERTRGGHSPETSRRKDELERDMQVLPARRLPQRRVVSVQPRDVRPEIDGMHVLPRGELRVRG